MVDGIDINIAAKISDEQICCQGCRRGGGRRGFGPPVDFEMRYFPISFLVEKCISFGFESSKRKLTTVTALWKKSLRRPRVSRRYDFEVNIPDATIASITDDKFTDTLKLRTIHSDGVCEVTAPGAALHSA